MLTMDRRKSRLLQWMAAPVLLPPSPQEEGTRGCRRGAGSQSPPLGGRPSAGAVPQGLPPAEDPWSSGELLATALPHWRRPWFPVAVDGGRVWRKAGPSSGDMKQGRYL